MGLIDLIASSPLPHHATSAQSIRFLDELLRDFPKHNLQVRFWDGQVWGSQCAPCTLVLKHPGTLRRLCTDPSELSLGEAYIYDDVDIQGNIESVFELADHLLTFGGTGVSHHLQLIRRFRELPNQNDGPLPEHRGRTLAGPLHSKKRDRLSYVAVERLTRGRPAAHASRLVSRLRKHIHGEACSLLGMTRALVCCCFLIILHSTLAAQSPGISANALARRVVENELRAEDQDKSHWMFRIETRKPDSGSEVDAVIQTSQGELQFPLLINGHPPARTEQEKAESRIQQLMNNPAAAQKSRKEKSEDYSRSHRMLKMLPEAFIYSYGTRQGDRVQLNFKPNPRFRSHGFEEEVFHAMDGSLWVDEKENRLAEMSGYLTNGVKFLGGLLGHLDKGGSFDVKQEPVVPGYWELTVLNVHMTGKALFFKTISEQQQFYRTEFKRVPDSLTLSQADEMLKKEVASYRNRLQEKQGF
jgi:hypothetical protein